MTYTNSITAKGQITLPKLFRDKLGLDKLGKADIRFNDHDEIVITRPKTPDDSLARIRAILANPSHSQPLTERQKLIGDYLAKKYHVR